MRTQLISNSTPDGPTPRNKHTPVLLQEVLESLDIQDSDIVFDGTLGSGGHASSILRQLSSRGAFLGSDLDIESINRTRENLLRQKTDVEFYLFHGSFENISEYLSTVSLKSVDKILLDLGWSQDQFESSGRGFSFMKDEPLLMTLKDSPSDEDVTAYDVVNFWSKESLRDIIKGFGQERFAARIAEAIVQERKNILINSSKRLADIISRSIPKRFQTKRIHPATRTFQAIRIAVNMELDVLDRSLDALHDALSLGGRIAVITFHSLEDRIVKHKFANWEKGNFGKRLSKKPITASREELEVNRRARSAKLRVYEKKTDK